LVLVAGEEGQHGVDAATGQPGDLLLSPDPPVLEPVATDALGYGQAPGDDPREPSRLKTSHASLS
jgi:hypothetical protein